MMLNKTFSCLAIFVFVLSLSALFSNKLSAKTLKIGLLEYPPHLSFKQELSQSKLYQYVEKTLKPLGYDVEFTMYPNQRGIVELKKGNIDLLLPYGEGDSKINVIAKPIFHSMPGLCFKKENFIPILSATHRFADLMVAVPQGITIVSALQKSEALLVSVKGNDAINRGIDLVQRGRIDAFYHPSPIKIYHRKNPAYKEVACSYFHGYSTGVYIAASDALDTKQFVLIENTFIKEMNELSYEYYFAK